jgi:LacI family transcriptional regulator, galactose operon repressor
MRHFYGHFATPPRDVTKRTRVVENTSEYSYDWPIMRAASQRIRPSLPHVAMLLETSTEYGRGLLRGIVKYVRLHGPWELSVAPGHFEQVLPKVNSWHVDGIIARVRSPEIEKLIRYKGVPFVASSLSESASPKWGERFGEIRTDSEAIAEMGAKHLLERGLRHFAFCGFIGCSWSEAREKVFRHTVESAGFPCFVHRIHLANWMQSPNRMEVWQNDQPALVEWLKSLPKRVGLMTCNDICGRDVLQTCAACGLLVPDEVAVIGVDNDEMMCELSNPPLSTITLNLESAGYGAARLLDDLMSGKLSGRHLVRVKPLQVVMRQSTDVIALYNPRVAKAVRFIRAHAGKPIGIPEVVNEVGTSRRTLERWFLRVIGRSLLDEITGCRLERAKRLLLETDLPCRLVGPAAGFGSQKTFNRTFRRIEAMPPGTFRKRAKIQMPMNASGSTSRFRPLSSAPQQASTAGRPQGV